MVMHARRKNSPPTRLAFSPLRRATLPALTSLAGEGWSVRINREIQAVAPSWAARAGLGRWFVFGINRGIQALPVYDVGRPRRITGKRILAPLHRRKGRIQFRLRVRRHRFQRAQLRKIWNQQRSASSRCPAPACSGRFPARRLFSRGCAAPFVRRSNRYFSFWHRDIFALSRPRAALNRACIFVVFYKHVFILHCSAACFTSMQCGLTPQSSQSYI